MSQGVWQRHGKIDAASAAQMIGGIAKSFSGNVFDFAHLATYLRGIQAAYADQPRSTDMFTAGGAKALDEIVQQMHSHLLRWTG
jgi:hypothetical protein